MDDLSRSRRGEAAPALDWLNGDVRELRERYERAYRVEDPGAHRWMALDLPDRRIELLVQEPAALADFEAVIVYFHGGGWIVGSPWTHADVSRAICERTGLRVVSVDYRLAPEFVAPAPVEDGLDVLRRVLSRGVAGLSPACAILCGDSAGGAVALAVERQAASGLRARILGVASLYGAFGLLDSASLRAKGSRAEGTDRECVARYWRLANAPGRPSPYSVEALSGRSPVPAYLLAGLDDPVLDDTLALARACGASARTHVLDKVEGADHGFLHDPATPCREATLDRLAAWMTGLLG